MDIGEVSEITKLKAHTLRYYESIGLIRNITRDSSWKRSYTEADLRWIEFINRLRQTGMNISKMRQYAELRYMGDSTITERKKIMQEHLASIDIEIKTLTEARDYVAKKIKIYIEMEENIDGEGKQV